jgi:hypothetical protein
MAKQRYISTSIWDDDWFVEELNVSEKLFYFYLLTNEHTNIAGIYKISIRKISQESGFSSKDVREMFKTLQRSRKVYYMDEHVIMTNWAKHQNWEKSKKVHLGIRAILIKDVPQSIIEAISKGNIPYAYPIDTLSDGIDALPIPHAYPTNYLDSDSDSDSNLDSDSNFTNTSCPEVSQEAETIETEATQIFIELPAIGSPSQPKKTHKVTEQDVEKYHEIYPAVDIRQELRQMAMWLEANPSRKKSNTKAFIVNWLKKAQDQSGSSKQQQQRQGGYIQGKSQIPGSVMRTNDAFAGRKSGQIDF